MSQPQRSSRRDYHNWNTIVADEARSACGADYDRAGVPERRFDAVKDRATAPVLKRIKIGPSIVIAGGLDDGDAVAGRRLNEIEHNRIHLSRQEPELWIRQNRTGLDERTSPAFICAMAVAIALAVLMNVALG